MLRPYSPLSRLAVPEDDGHENDHADPHIKVLVGNDLLQPFEGLKRHNRIIGNVAALQRLRFWSTNRPINPLHLHDDLRKRVDPPNTRQIAQTLEQMSRCVIVNVHQTKRVREDITIVCNLVGRVHRRRRLGKPRFAPLAALRKRNVADVAIAARALALKGWTSLCQHSVNAFGKGVHAAFWNQVAILIPLAVFAALSYALHVVLAVASEVNHICRGGGDHLCRGGGDHLRRGGGDHLRRGWGFPHAARGATSRRACARNLCRVLPFG